MTEHCTIDAAQSAAKVILGMKDSEVQDVQLEEPEELVEYTEDEEKRVLRKLDFILLPLLCLCYVFSVWAFRCPYFEANSDKVP